MVRDHAILQGETNLSALDALVTSLKTNEDWEASSALYAFLDNCILRFVRKTIKYYGDVADLFDNVLPSSLKMQRKPVSLLVIVILDQWSYLVEIAQASDLRNIILWVARFLEILRYIGEEEAVLLHVRGCLANQTPDKNCRDLIEAALVNSPNVEILKHLDQKLHTAQNHSHSLNLQMNLEVANKTSSSIDLPLEPSRASPNFPGLTRWLKKDIPEAVEGGAVGELISCLCSNHEEIRRQAILGVESLMAKLEVCAGTVFLE